MIEAKIRPALMWFLCKRIDCAADVDPDGQAVDLALREIDRETTERGFLVLLASMSLPRLPHGPDAIVEWHEMGAVPMQSESDAAETALIAPRPLRSMQGTCTRPFTGSQVMPR